VGIPRTRGLLYSPCPSMTLRCAIKAGEGRLFVKASATILCVRSEISLTIPALDNSQTKYDRISMCQQNFRHTGFSLKAMQAKLSSKMLVAAVVCGYPKSRRISRRYTTSWAAWLAATNSVSEVERETLSCRRLFLEMGSRRAPLEVRVRQSSYGPKINNPMQNK